MPGINQDFSALQTLRKNNVRLAVPMRGVMQMQDSDEIFSELERYREKERKEKDEREMIELNDRVSDEEENCGERRRRRRKSKLDGGARGDLGDGSSKKSKKKEEEKKEDASAPR